MELPAFLLAVTIWISTPVRGQFQVTSVNGRPVSGGSASASGGNTFGSANLANTNSAGSGSAGDSAFSITSVNGRPVVNNFNGQGGSTLLDTNKMRIEVLLVRFENPGSLMHDGQFCDTASKCDPRFLVDLDVVQPLAPFPGMKPVTAFQNLFEVTNKDVFDIGRSVVRDVCSSVSRANLRVSVSDIDDVTAPDLIDEYDCVFDVGRIAPDAMNADWSQLLECRSLRHRTPPFVKLFYRHREYALPRDNFNTAC
ncbi:hypothetical protein BV898_07261 [Hypsibius exemplaris]|uniref:Uncharacterized protein n=1 Tax=Hypsibius exemplaris TaxID=2072580 RepID=A0A1W0WTV8_HYPEX|nr:hypothetical protein BV898_07261 [Hypsibius exemplaris]